MRSIPDTPTLNEWITLIQQDPNQAKQHAILLRARIKKQGLMADPALTISVEDYDRAQHLLATATNDSQQAQRIARMTTLGQATLGPYPSREDWLALINADPTFARAVCVAWETKRALLGLQAPQALQRTIEIYYLIMAQQQT